MQSLTFHPLHKLFSACPISLSLCGNLMFYIIHLLLFAIFVFVRVSKLVFIVYVCVSNILIIKNFVDLLLYTKHGTRYIKQEDFVYQLVNSTLNSFIVLSVEMTEINYSTLLNSLSHNFRQGQTTCNLQTQSRARIGGA